MHTMASIKRQVLELIERLPKDATWDEIMKAIFVRRKIVESMAAADAGKLVSHKKVKARFLS